MNFDILQKPETSGDQREQYRWFYRICEILNDIGNIIALGAGFLVKTAAGAYTVRTITGTATEVDVANGDGVLGNPVIGLPTVISTPRSFGDGTNQTTFEADGSMKFEGAATVWNDINLSIGSLRAGASAPGTWTIPGTGIILSTFGGADPQQDAYGSLEILHDYKEGSDIVPHIHWSPTTTGAGDVVWQLEYSWVNGGGTVTSSTTIIVTVAANGVVAKEQRSSFPTISGTGKTIGSRFLFHLFRNSAHISDTYGSDAAALDFGIHYERDTTGSRQITTK